MTVPDKAQALVERLREYAVYTGKATRYMLVEAADELERLSAILSDQGRHAPVDAGGVEMRQAATVLVNNLWAGIVSGARTHDENRREFEKRYPGVSRLEAALAAASLPAAPVAVKELRWEDDPNPISERVDIIAFSASVAVGGVRESNSGRFRWEIVTLPGHAVSRDERSGWFDTLDAAKTEVQKHWGAWLQRAALHPAPASVVDLEHALAEARAERDHWQIECQRLQPPSDTEAVAEARFQKNRADRASVVDDAMMERLVKATRNYTRETLFIDEHRELIRAALEAALDQAPAADAGEVDENAYQEGYDEGLRDASGHAVEVTKAVSKWLDGRLGKDAWWDEAAEGFSADDVIQALYDVQRLVTPAAPNAVNSAVREALEKLRSDIQAEHDRVRGDDGYNYAAGHEYGLRVALLKIDAALASLSQPTPAGSAGEDKP